MLCVIVRTSSNIRVYLLKNLAKYFGVDMAEKQELINLAICSWNVEMALDSGISFKAIMQKRELAPNAAAAALFWRRRRRAQLIGAPPPPTQITRRAAADKISSAQGSTYVISVIM